MFYPTYPKSIIAKIMSSYCRAYDSKVLNTYSHIILMYWKNDPTLQLLFLETCCLNQSTYLKIIIAYSLMTKDTKYFFYSYQIIGIPDVLILLYLSVTNFSRPQIILHNWHNIRLGINFWLINDLITFDLIPITANHSALASIFNTF